MTRLSTMSRNFYLTMLASLGVIATSFAMMTSSSCFGFFSYQPKMPNSLIKND